MKRILTIVYSLVLSVLIVNAKESANEQLYIQRLSGLKAQVDVTYHPEVRKHIDAYLANPEKTREIVGLSKMYFPMLDRVLRGKSVPGDLKYLAVALSELDPLVQASSGASGIWLMSYQVSKMYKLKVNSYVDERKDQTKSSFTAATHLKDLYSIYRQWPLVIAAYANSPVVLNKAIRMAGNSMNYWDIYPFLPEGTREAYPKFIAAAYICNFYREHGVKPSAPSLLIETDSVLVNKWLSFQQISSTLDIPIEQLRRLNPTFKKDVIPYNLDGYIIRLPKSKGKHFDLLKDSVYKPLPNPTEFTPVAIQKTGIDSSKSSKTGPPETKPKEQTNFDKKRVYYVVKKNDKLSDVADWFDVTVFEVKSWNKLKSNQLKSGQKLTIWVKQSKTGYYKRINGMSPAQKKKLKKKD
ncbi:MAG: LysM peptidoglycan-binding domain-containing protein [Bacteroidia bacterium]|nr:LysM peptidoglycan-binding domain-containing protein [Bacteroidia bacterium]